MDNVVQSYREAEGQKPRTLQIQPSLNSATSIDGYSMRWFFALVNYILIIRVVAGVLVNFSGVVKDNSTYYNGNWSYFLADPTAGPLLVFVTLQMAICAFLYIFAVVEAKKFKRRGYKLLVAAFLFEGISPLAYLALLLLFSVSPASLLPSIVCTLIFMSINLVYLRKRRELFQA